jgi:hypothetical protein
MKIKAILLNKAKMNMSKNELKKLGLSLNEMVIECHYNANDCDLNSDFEWFYNSFYGNCYKFNPNGRMISSKPGQFNGLQIELYVGSPVDKYQFAYTTGVHVFVHNKSTIPNFSDGIDVPTGKSTNIAINRVYFKRIEKPFSECTKDLTHIDSHESKFYKMIIRANQTYHQKDCFDLCLYAKIDEQCNCTFDHEMNRFQRAQLCFSASELTCMKSVFGSFYSSDYRSTCNCPLECESMSYPLTTSSSDYPSDMYADILLSNPNFISKFSNTSRIQKEMLNKATLMINVYYEDLKYTMIEEVKKTELGDLFSSLGGYAGLFLGLSILSFIEIFELLIHIILILFSKHVAKDSST